MARTIDEGVTASKALQASVQKQSDLLNKVYTEVVALRDAGGLNADQQAKLDDIVNTMEASKLVADTETNKDDDDPST